MTGITLCKAGFHRLVGDKGLLFADLCLATLLPYLVQFFIWSFVYDNRGDATIRGFGYAELLLYYAYAIAFGRLNNGYGVVQDMSDAIAEGKLDTELVKPYPLPLLRFWSFFGEGLLYWLPILAIFVWRMLSSGHAPGPTYLLGLATVFLFSQVVCFVISFCVSLATFWLTRANVLLSVLALTTSFFGGTLLPPALWPDWLRPAMTYNPFRYLISAPAELFARTDVALLSETVVALLLYFAVFSLLAWAGFRRAMRDYTGVGG